MKTVFAAALVLGQLATALAADTNRESAASGFAPNDSGKPLVLYLFASSTCRECMDLKDNLLRQVVEACPGVAYQHIETDKMENFELQLLYEEHYGNDAEDSIKAFVGTVCLSGYEEIQDRLETTILQQKSARVSTPTPEEIRGGREDGPGGDPENAQGSGGTRPGEADPACRAPVGAEDKETSVVKKRFSKLGLGMIVAAGLVDGVNPCAFVTIVFFISVLANLRKSSWDILCVGTAFSLAVYLTYLALGLGIFRTIRAFSVHAGISYGLTVAAAALCLALSGFSFYDAYLVRRTGKGADMKLKLPKGIRHSINRLINTKMRTRNIVIWAFMLGALVSLLESFCTGQIYLPTIIYVLKNDAMNARALLYLMIYNAMFVVPLLVVFIVAFAGVRSKAIERLFVRNLAGSKILIGSLFLALAIVLAMML